MDNLDTTAERSRLFEQHRIREVISLNGSWNYRFPVEGTAIEVGDEGAFRRFELSVPGVWELEPELVNYRGQAIAETRFSLPKASAARLVFKGVSHSCRVYVDGEFMGSYHNAYTAFSIDFANLSAGEHRLELWISNEFGELSALHIPNDYYSYGGISRPVELQVLQTSTYIDWVKFTPTNEGGNWGGSFELQAVNLGEEAVEGVDFHLAVAGVEFLRKRVVLAPGPNLIKGEFQGLTVVPWTPSTPLLYFLEAKLNTDEGEDDWRDRVGFRVVTQRGQRLLLNGESILLKGFNRHEDHADYGCALPLAAMKEDLELCREMGANAIRTSHYPNDERFLDLCDELGLMVWEENHARGLDLGTPVLFEGRHPMKHPLFREQCRACNEEMVTQHFNHACIVMWGVLNECDTESDYGRSCYVEQLEQVKQLDPSRPTTYASCYVGRDRCQDLPDICSWNLYAEWYLGLSAAEHFEAFLEEHESLMQGKPLILSEFGGGALPGYHDPVRRAKWSEERQASILESSLRAYLSHERICGVFIWQFCDTRVDESWAPMRPRCMNNKGVVDERRRPKLAFETVKKVFAEYR